MKDNLASAHDMRRALLLALLLLVMPFSGIPVGATNHPQLTVSMQDRFQLSNEEVHFSIVADNLNTGSNLRLEWNLSEAGFELRNGTIERISTGSSKSFTVLLSEFMTDSNWYSITFTLFQDNQKVSTESKDFSVFNNVIEPNYSEIIMFGDSLSDMGNVKDSIMNLPSVPPYWQGRFSNGPVWVERLASDLGLSMTHGTGTATGNNRAYGGSQSGQGYSYILLPNTGTQINNYLANVKSTFSNSDLVVIWSGGNDFLYGIGNPNITHANTVSHIEEVIQANAQNILVPNLPPLDLTPEVRNRSSSEQQEIKSDIESYNSLLHASIISLIAQHGVNIIEVNTHSMFLQYLGNSSFLGLTNTVDMACLSSGSILPLPICNAGDPVVSNVDEYVFFDKAHPTAAMHQLISIQAMNALGIGDKDNDGVSDEEDLCAWSQQGISVDQFGCTYQQQDDDEDGISNADDDCPDTPEFASVDENGCSESQRDSDDDGLMDDIDPCPYSNSTTDYDRDGCDNDEDSDDDNDGIPDIDDNCPRGALGWMSSSELDIDGDGCRDIDEDDDDDGDGLTDLEEYQKGTDQNLWDTDGDLVNDKDDVYPLDSSQWSDLDGDGYSDQPAGSTPDSHPDDASQWNDSDGDGYGDNPIGIDPDLFPSDLTQWNDSDGDGFGDNLEGWMGDACPNTSGQSLVPPGCPDRDQDGYADDADPFPDNPNQWNDSDGDGYGDNLGFADSDKFPTDIHEWYDNDGDGYGDLVQDSFPDDPLEWNDSDGDGCGDNSDIFPDDPTECHDWDGDGIGDNADAFRRDASEWKDSDGDGYGDNVDAFPLDSSEWNDKEGDGIGDNLQATNSQGKDSTIFYMAVSLIIVILSIIFFIQKKKPATLDLTQQISHQDEL